ncbi:MAG: thiol:disulfide interchange protein DsbA/DsbL [Pseudomonadota bacterium]
MAKKGGKFLLWQKITVGAVAVLIVGVLGYLYTLVLTEAPLGEFVEGEHYTTLTDPRRVRGDKIEVMEFFSYACIHCYNFDPDLEAWAAANEDRVEFVRTPAVGSNFWRLLGRTYYTMAELGALKDNHTALFREIHDVRRPLDSPEKLTAWMVDRGVSENAFRSMFNSPLVNRHLETADQLARRLRVASVPTIVVNGKYMVNITSTVGTTRMLEVMDHLVAKEMAARNSSSADTD